MKAEQTTNILQNLLNDNKKMTIQKVQPHSFKSLLCLQGLIAIHNSIIKNKAQILDVMKKMLALNGGGPNYTF